MIKSKTFLQSIKLTTWLFLLGELLDCLTTAIALGIGGVEGNALVYVIGWNKLILAKVIVTVFVACMIQYRLNVKWMEWLMVIAGSLVVPWNIAMIIKYLLV